MVGSVRHFNLLVGETDMILRAISWLILIALFRAELKKPFVAFYQQPLLAPLNLLTFSFDSEVSTLSYLCKILRGSLHNR